MSNRYNFDKNKALNEQKQLLTLKKERLISAIDGAVKGENVMKAFDNSEFEKYKAEAREKWAKRMRTRNMQNGLRTTPSRSGMTLPREWTIL